MKPKYILNSIAFSLVFVFIFTTFSQVQATSGVRVWIEFTPGTRGSVQSSLNRAGADIHYTFDDLNSFVATLPENALSAFENNPNVISVEFDPERYPVSTPLISGILAETLDTIGPNGQIIPWGVDAVQSRDVWDYNRDGVIDAGITAGSGKILCIIDSGYYSTHEDLSGATLIGGVSQVDNDYTRDGLGHGTHVAGTIVGVNNSMGVVGVSPSVSLYIVKFFNDTGSATFASDLVAAANTCANNGADIISMSLGGSRFNGKENRAFRNLNNAGVLSIAAAGNDGNTAHSYPASYNSVMSVAALNESLTVADFSQQTDQVEISGPGVGVLSTVPYLDNTSLTVGSTTYSANHIELSARGSVVGSLVNGGLCTSSGSWSGLVVLCERGDISFYDKVINAQNGGAAAVAIYNNVPGGFLGTLGDDNISNIVAISLSQADGQSLVDDSLGASGAVDSQYFWPTSGYEFFDGTSMATPHVSAVAALIWSNVPGATNQQVRDALTSTALDLGSLGRDNAYGYGLVQASSALAFLSGGTGSNDVPTVSIDNPANGSSYNFGETVNFSGSASDNEDGNLSSSISWSSNIDGNIGTGASVSTILSDGIHTIAASILDSGGKTGTDSITITIEDGGSGEGTLHVTIATDKSNYVNRETAIITVTVVDDSLSPVDGAIVEVRVLTPKGKTYIRSITSDANGTAVFSFKVNIKKDGIGTYDMTTTASKTNYVDGFDSTNFTAN